MTEQEPMQPTSPSQREALSQAVATYTKAASDDPIAQLYLEGRGISAETAATFRLGVVNDPAPGHERYRGMLAIPYLHHSGYPLTVRFRCIEDHNCKAEKHGKYRSMPDDPSRMYNTGAILAAGSEIHVTEGEFDAMLLCQLGYPAVALPGATTWRPRHRVMLAGFSRVFVWGDPDDAGADFVNTICRSMRQARGVPIKDDDVTANYLTHGERVIHDLVNDLRDIDFLAA